MAIELEGRVALVTGAGRRVGRAIAERLAALGMRVVLHHRRSRAEVERLAETIAAAGGEASVVAAELSDADAARGLVREAKARFGRLDLLVNNAAVFRPARADRLDVADWDRTLAVNLRAPAICSFEAIATMADGGAIVNVVDAALAALPPEYMAYKVSKAGLSALTRELARAGAPTVRVNAVAPGPILPPEGEHDAAAADPTARTVLGRWGDPSDVADAVAYLASAAYVTGVVLPVDGGAHLA